MDVFLQSSFHQEMISLYCYDVELVHIDPYNIEGKTAVTLNSKSKNDAQLKRKMHN